MIKFSFKPGQVSKRLLEVLSERSADILDLRYGLSKKETMTLEAIGKKYDITRERVRQIENNAIDNVVNSEAYEDEQPVFEELKNAIHDMGALVSEREFLKEASSDEITRNNIHFLLVLGKNFEKHKEDEHFVHRWNVDPDLAQSVHNALKRLYDSLDDEDLIPESEMIDSFLSHLKESSHKYRDKEVVKRWLRLSKKIDRNPLGEWGVSHSSNINLKGIRDYAYLVLRQHGSPLHFTEVARRIGELFDKKAHTATTHNELIKDDRFVLVGRGLYALSEWGYMTGVVKDVIAEILEKEGPLTKEEVIEKVLRERYVKNNTIVVNLQDNELFDRDEEGRYFFVGK